MACFGKDRSWSKYNNVRCKDGIRECYRCKRMYNAKSGLKKVVFNGQVYKIPYDIDGIGFICSPFSERPCISQRVGPRYNICPSCCAELMSWLTGYGMDLRYLEEEEK